MNDTEIIRFLENRMILDPLDGEYQQIRDRFLELTGIACCPNCGNVNHTIDELAVCMASMTGPGWCQHGCDHKTDACEECEHCPTRCDICGEEFTGSPHQEIAEFVRPGMNPEHVIAHAQCGLDHELELA